MKKSPLFKVLLAVAALSAGGLAAAALAAAPASADVVASKALVDSAKARGVVGERSDGYLGFVTASSDAALRAAVDEINAGRREVFAQAAAKNGVSIDAAAASAYTTSILPKVKNGQYYQDATGAWVQK